MVDIKELKSNDEIAWCPGCGNFGILLALKKAVSEMGKDPKDILLVSGIGQAAKLPHYIRCNCFNGLHGRALPAAAGAKISNRALTVIVTTGDGDCYGEGGNHLIHNIRRNVDMTVIVHNNQIYGLTKGQASPTTDLGYVTKVQTGGVILEPFHALPFAIALGCGFVGRGYSQERDHLTWLIKEAIQYKGFSLIEVLQPCVSFNKKNTYEWYKERIDKVDKDDSFNAQDISSSFAKAMEWGDKIPVGILRKYDKETYEKKSGLEEWGPLVEQDIERVDLSAIWKDFS